MRRLLLLGLILGLLVVPHTALAFDPFAAACSGSGSADAKKSVACASAGQKTNPLTGSDGTIMKVERVIAAIAGFAAVVIIIVNGIRLTATGGDPQKATAARNGIIEASIGLVIIIAAQAGLTFIIRGIQ